MKKKINPFDKAIIMFENQKPSLYKNPIHYLSDVAFDFFCYHLNIDNIILYNTHNEYYEVLYMRLLLAREIWKENK